MRILRKRYCGLMATAAFVALAPSALAQENSLNDLTDGSVKVAAADDVPLQIAATEGVPVQVAGAQTMPNAPEVERVLITARRREEDAQDVPVSASVVTGVTLDKFPTFNLQQLTQLVPSLNYTSPNPRNTAFTIRGLGSSVVAIAQANDGLEPGVGFYIDQVYYGRPATAAFDFVDIDRVEVLRGPQGTLFGKNTTAGAIVITTRAPTFDREIEAELTGGNFGFVQGKGAISGAIVDDLVAGRLSVQATRRGGVIHNVVTGVDENDIINWGVRGQILYRPNENFNLTVSTDFDSFAPTCCTQVFLRVAPTLKPAAQQYPALAAGIGYVPPSTNPYDRLTDIDAALGVTTSEGGLAGVANWNIGFATLTSVSAWRWWDWDAANDRDYTALHIQLLQHIPSRQIQYSQELRIASNGMNTVDYVAGLYWFEQRVQGHPITQYGSDGAYWLVVGPPAIPSNLLTGYTSEGHTKFISDSYAVFGEATWHVLERLDASLGLRYTYEDKDGTFNSIVYGGLDTSSNPALRAKQLQILRPQAYTATVSDGSVSGRANVSYKLTDDIMGYAIYSQGYKSGGINMSGLPLNAANQPALDTAVIKPERNTTIETGVKSELLDRRLTLNVDGYITTVHDFQANVVDNAPGALRGYLANVPKVRVQGIEFDSLYVVNENFSGYLNGAWTDGQNVSYPHGPCPIELTTTATTQCNLSGKPLSGVPKYVIAVGGEYVHNLDLGAWNGQGFVNVEANWRTKTYGESSDSKYTVIEGYGIVNLNIGFRQAGPWEAFFWVKNLFDKNYIQNVTVQAGNSGLILATPSDPRTFGITLRVHY
jgi:iron complex outermembrane receptor protein